MNRDEFLLPFLIGLFTAAMLDRETVAGYIIVGLLVFFVIVITALDYLYEREERKFKHTIADQTDIVNKILASLLGSTPKTRGLKNQHHTLSGKAATDDVKNRARVLFEEKIGGGDSLWDSMPDVGKESWYKEIEEDDKEKQGARKSKASREDKR